MTEFREASFQDKNTMWGFEPADSAITTADLFQKNGLNKILIPGFGYGRNAKIFSDNGFNVTGYEFGRYGLIESIEIKEPAKSMEKPHQRMFWQVICQKPEK